MKKCRHEWIPITSEKDYAASIEEMERFDIDHFEESAILGFICKKCKFTLSVDDFKEFSSFEKSKFDMKYSKFSLFISIFATIISLISLVLTFLK